MMLSKGRGCRNEGRHDAAVSLSRGAVDERPKKVEGLADVLHGISEVTLQGGVVGAPTCFTAREGASSRMESATALSENTEAFVGRKGTTDEVGQSARHIKGLSSGNSGGWGDRGHGHGRRVRSEQLAPIDIQGVRLGSSKRNLGGLRRVMQLCRK
ncbi:hypothetical protein AB1Y20_008407 [Prymnesium parvum]|uniref:Uncharacterized protein n=1 Tax=Prymnesium parvum TaxID=97485 RepID=A0AB34IT15_PRYPA